jgi:lipopolysaccharide-induced tumor necrosis factor-alpha factor
MDQLPKYDSSESKEKKGVFPHSSKAAETHTNQSSQTDTVVVQAPMTTAHPPPVTKLETQAGAQIYPEPQIIVSQPYIISMPSILGEYSVACECPNCHRNVQTQVEYKNGALTWMLCILLFIFTFICFFIPFLIKGTKDTIHICPNCRSIIGTYQRI